VNTVLLISPHRWNPKCTPHGLEHLAHHLHGAGFDPLILDINILKNQSKEISDVIIQKEPILICITIRNFDSAFLAQPMVFFPKAIKKIINSIRKITDSPIVIGGVSYSAAPIPFFKYFNADYGIVGSDERSMVTLAETIKKGDDKRLISGLVWKNNSKAVRNKVVLSSDPLPPIKRNFADQLKTYSGGIENHYSWASVETKRGCSKNCIYCIEPMSKGCTIRYKKPEAVIAELIQLKTLGINWFWFTDSEFNLNLDKAKELCEALIKRYNGSINWGSYALPKPFDKELANLMEKSGCKVLGIDAGHGSNEMLKNYQKDFLYEDIVQCFDLFKNRSVKLKLSALVGGPGESEATIKNGLKNLAALGSIVELGVGLRVYPSTPIINIINKMDENQKRKSLFGRIKNNGDFLEPVFYFAPEIALNYKAILEKVTREYGSFMLPPLYQVNEEEINGWRGFQPGYSSARSNDLLLRKNGSEEKTDASYF